MSRPPDLSFEALVEVTGATISAERGSLNAALKQIREAMPEATDEELAGEIRYRAKVYRETWQSIALTPTALAKHWERVPLEAPKPTYPTRTEGGTCATCDGVTMVLVGTRPAAAPVNSNDTGHDLMAPCPDCNSGVDAGFWRVDGSRFTPPDPGRVREMMSG